MNLLALDLGSTTGYCYGPAESLSACNSLTWASQKELKDMRARRLDRRGDTRIVRFFDWLTNLHAVEKFDAVVFEDVQFHTSTAQSQLWSSFRTTVWLAFPGTLIEAVPVGSLKKWATGSGAADKENMRAALVRRLGVVPVSWDDNAVDAYFLFCWGQQHLSRAKI